MESGTPIKGVKITLNIFTVKNTGKLSKRGLSYIQSLDIVLDMYNSGLSQAGGPGGHVPPQFLADQLTLSQPGGAHYPHPVLQAPPDFQTLRRPC